MGPWLKAPQSKHSKQEPDKATSYVRDSLRQAKWPITNSHRALSDLQNLMC